MFVGLAILAAGCWRSTTETTPTTTGAKDKGAATEGQCESVLTSIDDIFELSRLGRVTSVADGVARLNDWQRACGSDIALPDQTVPDAAQKLFSDEQTKMVDDRRFLFRDGEHLRDCILERAISGYAAGTGPAVDSHSGNAPSELERVTRVFEYLVRAVGLVREPLRDLPLTPYEICLFGKGTAEDRAWIFVNVLRQLKVDAVLLLPRATAGASASDSKSTPLLVGVLLDEHVYLFDPRAGVTVPALIAETPAGQPPRAATLEEAAADPAVLKQLDDGPSRPYPIMAADLAHPAVAIVGDSSLWSGRMQALQTQFVGRRAMVVSDPLADAGDDAPGAWTRVLKAGGRRWSADDMRLWEYPEIRLAAHQKMTSAQRDVLEGLMRPFHAFLNVKSRFGQVSLEEEESAIDPAADKDYHPGMHVNVRKTKGAQMQARMAHLAGDFAQAIHGYLDVRGRSREVLQIGPRLDIRSMHVRAVDDATYWTAVCQYEQGEFKAASNTLAKYRKQADPEKGPSEPGNWDRESRYLLALSLAATEDYDRAIRELERAEPDDLEYAGYRWLIGQWKKAREAQSR